MNRENKRRKYDKRYYKTHPCTDSFTCRVCGKISSNRIAADDNPMRLMALAMRPFGSGAISQNHIQQMIRTMED